jgi:hypothetical protein
MFFNFLKFLGCIKDVASLMTPTAALFKKNFPDKKDFWENELKSLGIESKRENELNDETELEALTEMIKQVYYQDYKTAYGESNKKNNNDSSNSNNNNKNNKI